MILPEKLRLLFLLQDHDLRRAILDRREIIRSVRDEKGDDRCFLDYYRIWEMVASSPPMPRFRMADGMKLCTLFYDHCKADAEDRVPRGTFCLLNRWDANLRFMNHNELVRELSIVQRAIIRHRDIEKIEHRPRTIDDDRNLYDATLPERIPGDFRLPPRKQFLISENDHSGCPAFWRSHEHCGGHCDLHEWGPCDINR